MNDALQEKWHNATGNLPYGVQRAFLDVLNLVAEGKKKDLVYGADYTDKGACLVNSAANMLVVGGGSGIPIANFQDVVSTFDQINQMLHVKGVNESSTLVSPLAAEIMVKWYAPLKDAPEQKWTDDEHDIPVPYVEPSDEEMNEAFMTLLNNRPIETPFDVLENVTSAQE